MAFIGNTNTTQAFTPAVDFFSGNGSTTAFTLSRPVASVAQVQVTIDNVAQNPSSAYTVSANTITFTSAPLSGTNNIYVYYTSPITQVIAPGQGTVTTTSLNTSSLAIPVANISGTLPIANGGTGSTSTTFVNAATNVTGTLPVANGGTGLATTPANGALDIGNGTGFTRTTLTAGSGVSITNGAGSISIAATGGGTVTSVATGNGLSGGTITTTGTLIIACPTFNSIGSYCYGRLDLAGGGTITSGADYSAGTANNQVSSSNPITGAKVNNLSGTWRYMGGTGTSSCGEPVTSLFCRVS